MEKEIKRGFYEGERSLFASEGLKIYDTIFGMGESPLKESRDLELYGCMFKWKYPLWYCENVLAKDCTWFDTARAGVWYSNNVTVSDCSIQAPKNFRRCKGLTLKNVSFADAAETLWNCENITVQNVTAKGDYFGMNSKDICIDGLTLYGNYSFDGAENVEIKNSRLLSKDAFWNSKNVTVSDSYIYGEYLGWNSQSLTLINCTVESLQGLCYIDGLVMKNCKLINTTLAFEYSTVDVDINGKADSIKNPSGGVIRADTVDELIMQRDRVDVSKTKIILRQDSGKKVCVCRCISGADPKIG